LRGPNDRPAARYLAALGAVGTPVVVLVPEIENGIDLGVRGADAET
jgi:hypothetical protein